ncbi:MAG: hypothetical protein V4547_16350 [Bacteroidota bacterium]
MEAIITEQITPAGFEIVRDRIGEILFLELTKQKELFPANVPEKLNIFSEAIVPQEITEQVFINVLLDSEGYPSENPKSANAKTTFFVDIYTTGSETPETSGDTVSSNRLHRYIRFCRYILRSGKYSTLGFANNIIGGKSVEGFEVLMPAQKEDSAFTRFARLTFSVRLTENEQLWQGIALAGNDTGVKLQQTDDGYKYVFENN